jgi:2-amino-4-hydroxy-6-hydroxymethyldihydropteridine diphosphokinase
MVKVYLGLGSNLGNKKENIQNAIALLKEGCVVTKTSSMYKTEPVGFKDQDWFINCVLEMETDLSPEALLIFIQAIEQQLGRERIIKDGPRTIDIDILLYGDEIFTLGFLTIPHPRMHERNFVLTPLKELCPELIHPVLHKTISELAEVPRDTVEFF